MAGVSQFFAGHPTIQIGAGLGDGSSAVNAGSSALAIKQRTGTTIDGLYWVKPPSGLAVQVWCDMNTDGGGWILVARTHPAASFAAGTWGWRGVGGGAPATYGAGYQLNILSLYSAGYQFSELIYGHQLANNSNAWGPFIYKKNSFNTFDLMLTDAAQVPPEFTLKFDLNVYGSAGLNPMQQCIGFCTTGTNQNMFFVRDAAAFAPTWGIFPTGIVSLYQNATSPAFYSGPWLNNTLSGNLWVQGGSSSVTNIGGTNQVMIMIR